MNSTAWSLAFGTSGTNEGNCRRALNSSSFCNAQANVTPFSYNSRTTLRWASAPAVSNLLTFTSRLHSSDRNDAKTPNRFQRIEVPILYTTDTALITLRKRVGGFKAKALTENLGMHGQPRRAAQGWRGAPSLFHRAQRTGLRAPPGCGPSATRPLQEA